jgi:release factor glutamine methyltransferase
MDIHSLDTEMSIIKRWGLDVCWNKRVYDPSDDTFLLLEYIYTNRKVFYGKKVLEIGTGTGIVGLYMLLNGSREVFLTDINPYALEAAKCSLDLNQEKRGIAKRFSYSIIGCDLLECLRKKPLFDIIVFNPPYLPIPCMDDFVDLSWCNGLSVLSRFLKHVRFHLVPGGRVLFIVSDKLPLSYLLSSLREHGFTVNIVSEKKLFFEKLLLVNAVKREIHTGAYR